MIYKGYAEKIEFDDEAMAFHGEVIGIRDVVTFQGLPLKSFDRLLKILWTIISIYAARGERSPTSRSRAGLLPAYRRRRTERYFLRQKKKASVLRHGSAKDSNLLWDEYALYTGIPVMPPTENACFNSGARI
jgi:hypothetical protein